MKERDTYSKIIELINAPLGFFVLALLIIESFLTIIITNSKLETSSQMIYVFTGVILFAYITILVFILVWRKPKHLVYDKESHLKDPLNPVSKKSKPEIPELIEKSVTEEEFHKIVAAALQYYNTARFDLAIKCGEDALKIKPNNTNLRNWLTVIYGEKLNNKERAIFHCNKILTLEPGNISAMFNLAVYTNHSKGSDLSFPIYLEVEKLTKELKIPEDLEINAKLNLFIGHDYRFRKNKDIPEARARYKKAISLFQQRIKVGDKTGVSKFWLKDAQKNLSELENENT